jgi:hypothetical protein
MISAMSHPSQRQYNSSRSTEDVLHSIITGHIVEYELRDASGHMTTICGTEV